MWEDEVTECLNVRTLNVNVIPCVNFSLFTEPYTVSVA